MKKMNLLIILLLTAAMAFPQHRLMQVHSAGEVAYEINTAQVDSVTFRQNGELPKEKCKFDNPLTDLLWLKDIIDEFEKDVETGNEVHAKIYQCTYKDGIGFLVEPCVGCPDAGYTLTSCEGEALCLMGGLLGDPCTEFDIDFENKALIWEMNERAFGEPVEIPFTEYSLEGTSCQWTNLNYPLNGELIIVNSDEELEKFIVRTDGSYPGIDFSKHTLLLSSGLTTNGIHAVEKQLQQLSINEYKLNVEITLNDTLLMKPWVIAVFTEKLNKNIKLNIIVIKE